MKLLVDCSLLLILGFFNLYECSNATGQNLIVSRPSSEEIKSWSESFQKLLNSSSGRMFFQKFLNMWWKEEIFLFWKTCKELNSISNPRIIEEKIKFIYENFIKSYSPQEVLSLDWEIRSVIIKNKNCLDVRSFDEAQAQMYSLMSQYWYRKFLNSKMFKTLLEVDSDSAFENWQKLRVCNAILPNKNVKKRRKRKKFKKKPSKNEIQSWNNSFQKLLNSSTGRLIFKQFLFHYCNDDYILFWEACEELKRETNEHSIEEKVKFIYITFILISSPKQVKLDEKIRTSIIENIDSPTTDIYDQAQTEVYTLMQRDWYPKFLKSEIYQRLLLAPQIITTSKIYTNSSRSAVKF